MAAKANQFVMEDDPGLEHTNGLYNYAYILSGDRTEAEDLVQETYLRALGALSRLRDGSNKKGWLFTILRNIWFNQLRQRRLSQNVVDIDIDQCIPDKIAWRSDDPLARLIGEHERDCVRKAIQQLPLIFREVIVLREYEELSYAEIAGLLNVPVGTVMSRLGRARAQLRSLLSTFI